ncbi:MAG: FliM/FliN family flagellar motor switch protein [Acidobacteriota bacterium]|nr:MAG: FliM/FliN family flagellar motor switch protein [Acidobacteriota bacterium]
MTDVPKPTSPPTPSTPAPPSASQRSAPPPVGAPAGGPTEAPPGVSTATGGQRSAALLERLALPVEIRFGKLVWTLRRVLDLRVGDAVPLGPENDDAVTLYVQGRPYARGELVIVDGRFGFRVTSLVSEEQR